MHPVASVAISIMAEMWALLQDASIYIILGLLVGGILKAFLSPDYVAAHLGTGRFRPVIKAALLGIPIPLCSCGVLPAAAALKKQGANNGATTAFLISTPESGVDSIAISWVLLDPLMTIFRPVAAFLTALIAGSCENLLRPPKSQGLSGGRPLITITGGLHSSRPEGLSRRLGEGLRYAFRELWGDLAVPFFFGLLFAGVVVTLIPDNFFEAYLGGGVVSMLVMLLCGIPLYICATASTPIAAALILKGVSPGAVLVFLLAGPATNLASLTVLARLLGKGSVTIYLSAIAVVSVLCGMALDHIYSVFAISARAQLGQAGEIMPYWLRTVATLPLLILSIKPLSRMIAKWLRLRPEGKGASDITS